MLKQLDVFIFLKKLNRSFIKASILCIFYDGGVRSFLIAAEMKNYHYDDLNRNILNKIDNK